MKAGDKVKLVYGGGHVGVITHVETKYQVSYPLDGRPGSGQFSECELELTNESPCGPQITGFKSREHD